MPQLFRKKCSRCRQVFESRTSKGCPACGCPDFKFTRDEITYELVEGIAVRTSRCDCFLCHDREERSGP